MLTAATPVTLSPGATDATAPSDKTARHAKLVHAAQQFEAVMLAELMKPLEQTASMGASDAEQDSKPMQAYGVEALAGSLARSGALGFADRMVAAVEKRQ